MTLTTDIILQGLGGGVLIGLGAALMLLGPGRIAGVSGIFFSVVRGPRAAARTLFLAGLLVSPWLVWLAGFGRAGADLLASPSWPKVLLSGLLVGIGTQLGSGCTSGHGVCGIANFSGRGLTATVTFMLVAGLVVLFGFGGLA